MTQIIFVANSGKPVRTGDSQAEKQNALPGRAALGTAPEWLMRLRVGGRGEKAYASPGYIPVCANEGLSIHSCGRGAKNALALTKGANLAH